GRALSSLGKPTPAVKAYEQSSKLYPFLDDWEEAARAIAWESAARKLIARSAKLAAPTSEEALPLAEQRFAQAFAWKRAKARAVLDRALARWPEHVGLLAARAELDGVDFKVRLACGRRALERKPDLTGFVRLVRLLLQAKAAGEA